MCLGFDSIEESIAAFKRGDFVVVLDSQDRENEGDLIIAAEDVTTEKMAFMVKYTSGLICVPLTDPLAIKLCLPQMVAENDDPNQTAYTISVDFNDLSITTGISAHDRALTVRALACAHSEKRHFRRPGHIFPLRARGGGISERPGHTEAAVEFCRLAGKNEVAAICELVQEGYQIDGVAEVVESGMMRKDGCLKFAKRWGLKACTIEDLAKYVHKTEAEKCGKC